MAPLSLQQRKVSRIEKEIENRQDRRRENVDNTKRKKSEHANRRESTNDEDVRGTGYSLADQNIETVVFCKKLNCHCFDAVQTRQIQLHGVKFWGSNRSRNQGYHYGEFLHRSSNQHNSRTYARRHMKRKKGNSSSHQARVSGLNEQLKQCKNAGRVLPNATYSAKEQMEKLTNQVKEKQQEVTLALFLSAFFF